MALHFQVYAEFSLYKGRPSLVGLSINSTMAACTSWPFSPYDNKLLTTSRIFRNLKEAHSYIAYLQGLYKKPIQPLILYSGQLELFPEVTE